MPSQRLIRLLLLSAACLQPLACATTSYSRSGVAAVPPGLKGKAGSNAKVDIEGVTVRVLSLDYARRDATIPSFALRLVFEPREIGYSFDPAQVVLRDESGASWSPRVSGPGHFTTSSWSCSSTGATGALASRYHPLAPGSCFELAFDVALGREQRLELTFGGLARGARRLDPVSLPLARRDGRSLDRVYWLEVLLAPLAVLGGGI